MNYAMPSLAITNEKGGVGKTFLTASIAEWAARYLDLHVLVIDTDIQCNLTAILAGLEFISSDDTGVMYRVPLIHPDFNSDIDEESRPSVSACFDNGVIMPYPTWIASDSDLHIKGHVDVLAGHGEKLEHLVCQSADISQPIYDSIAALVQSAELAEIYDLVILDTNPNRNLLSRSVLRSASHVLIPMEFDVHCIDGIRSALSSIQAENQYRSLNGISTLQTVGLLPNRFVKGSIRSKGISQLNYEDLKKLFSDIFLSEMSFIPQAEVVKKVLSGKHHAQSIFDITRRSKSEYRLKLALEHACVEILRSLFPNHIPVTDKLDQHHQRVRRELKRENVLLQTYEV